MSYTISSHDADKSVTNEKKEETRENYASVNYDTLVLQIHYFTPLAVVFTDRED